MKYLIPVILGILLNFSNMFSQDIITGANQPEKYIPLLKGKNIAIVTNQTGQVGKINLVDFLHSENQKIQIIFSPEHGFRGTADAGEKVNNSIDEKTGITIHSLYGKNSKNSLDSLLKNIEIVVFDLQDVGLRYYTYLTTMIQIMDACANQNIKLIVLDRPNPNGFYVDGPILDMKYKSTVGFVPVPVVHGMTLGELALMANGEKWLNEGKSCNLTIIPCVNYTHKSRYILPVAPSPNLPNMRSVYLYPSLCYFEATPISLGRGTKAPFQQFGSPDLKGYTYSFTPESIPGAKNPPHLNKICFGVDLQNSPSDNTIIERGIDLSYLIEAYKNLSIGDTFFNPFFEKLIGVDYVRKMIIAGKEADDIKKVWEKDVIDFKQQRQKYLLYID